MNPGTNERPRGESASSVGLVAAACSSYGPSDIDSALTEVFALLGGVESIVSPGRTVLIKPNLFGARLPGDAATTHPALVREVVQRCVRAGAGRVWVGDSPVGWQDEVRLWERTGMTAAVAGTPAELKSWRVTQAPIDCGGDPLPVPEWYRDVDAVISMPKLKAHTLTRLSCALKNVYGLVSGHAKTVYHLKYPSPEAMAGFLVRVFGVLKPALTIVDGVVAMEGRGPSRGRPVSLGLILAGCDAVAVDAAACGLMDLTPAAVPMLRLAAAAGMGTLAEGTAACRGSGFDRLRRGRIAPSPARWLERIPTRLIDMLTAPWRMGPTVAADRCRRCGTCVAVCPRGAVTQDAATGLPRVDRRLCAACLSCVESCPQGAGSIRFALGSRVTLGRKRRGKGSGRLTTDDG